jgi:CO/xanthine dehydrogenase Mo-binding subunit
VKAAPHRLTVNLKQHRGGAHPIEGRGLIASFDAASDLLTVWSSTQLAHEARYFIMKLLGLDENRIRVVTPDVGGGFGAKFILYPEEVAISAASLLLRRPVKWIEDRREHFMASIQEREQYWDVEVGFDDDGRPARRQRNDDQRCRRLHLSRASICTTTLRRTFPALTSCRTTSCRCRWSKPTRCRRRRCAAPAIRKAALRWSGCLTPSRATAASIAWR